MIKLNKDDLGGFSNSTIEPQGILIGYKKDEHDKPIFIYFNKHDDKKKNSNIIIFGKPESGKGYYVK